ncbi:MAG TPA: PspC domain-containing protein [Gemmatimonadaceae bacterium]|jgi:phage shock protein PspC (stress-responsive transcriptional regulator)|nr:PspC domain-containing protein [Gemmatimonadaceae bacterium]
MGGILFEVEADAYRELYAYLEAVTTYVGGYPNAQDIVVDIERRLGEQLAKSGGPSRVVLLAHVERAIASIQSVEEFWDGEGRGGWSASTAATHALDRRFYRDRDESVIAGVAAGIGDYFDLSPTRFRLLFLFLFLVGGGGLLAYLALWLCVPEAKTTIEKMRMHGEPITLATIAQRVRRLEVQELSIVQKAMRSVLRVLTIGVGCAPIIILVCIVIFFIVLWVVAPSSVTFTRP